MEYGRLLYGKMLPLKLKEADYNSYVRPVVLNESKEWCLKESEMRILRRTERSMMREMSGVQLKDREIHDERNEWSTAQGQRRSMMRGMSGVQLKCKKEPRMLMVGQNETIDQLAMANSVCVFHRVMWREDSLTLKIALQFEDEGQRRKGRRHGRSTLRKKA